MLREYNEGSGERIIFIYYLMNLMKSISLSSHVIIQFSKETSNAFAPCRASHPQVETNRRWLFQLSKCYQWMRKLFQSDITSHLTSWLFSRNSLTALRATLQAASLGYPYIPVEMQGKAWDHWLRNTDWCFADVNVRYCIWQTEYR